MNKEFYIFFSERAKKIFLIAKNILFPVNCLGCGQDDFFICHACSENIKLKETQICPFCKTASLYGQTCHNCQKSYNLDGAWVASSYKNKLLAKAIKFYKFKFIIDLADSLSNLLCRFWQERVLPFSIYKSTFPKSLLSQNKTVIIPVPLHKKRENFRGFNQAEIIAEKFSQNFPYKILSGLQRIKYKKAQALLNKEDRLINIQDAFIWTGKKPIAKNIILIDDIFTSGATLEECAKVLKKNGAKKIWGLVLARG